MPLTRDYVRGSYPHFLVGHECGAEDVCPGEGEKCFACQFPVGHTIAGWGFRATIIEHRPANGGALVDLWRHESGAMVGGLGWNEIAALAELAKEPPPGPSMWEILREE